MGIRGTFQAEQACRGEMLVMPVGAWDIRGKSVAGRDERLLGRRMIRVVEGSRRCMGVPRCSGMTFDGCATRVLR
jgi:hypothetical protein